MKINNVVIIIQILLLSACQNSEIETQKSKATVVNTTHLIKDDVTRYHKISAILMAKNRADLAFQLSGEIENINVEIGQLVEKDQALIHLYNPNTDPAIKSDMAQLESINAKIDQVKKDLINLASLRKNKATSKNSHEQKETELKDLQAQKKSINSQIELSLANQSESIIKAPFDATVVNISKQVGEFINTGTPVITLYQQHILEVEINITRNLWKNLSLTDTIQANFDNQLIEFNVSELSQTAEPRSHLMKVILTLKSDLKNSIGQQVTLLLPENFNNIYQLPLESVVDDGINTPYIFLSKNNKAEKLPIIPIFIEKGIIYFKVNNDIKNPVITKGQSKISQGTVLVETS